MAVIIHNFICFIVIHFIRFRLNEKFAAKVRIFFKRKSIPNSFPYAITRKKQVFQDETKRFQMLSTATCRNKTNCFVVKEGITNMERKPFLRNKTNCFVLRTHHGTEARRHFYYFERIFLG
jgi:hypothetical protein